MTQRIVISNWWCPKCKRQLSSEDTDQRRVHYECGERAQWRRYLLNDSQRLLEDDDGDRNGGGERVPA